MPPIKYKASYPVSLPAPIKIQPIVNKGKIDNPIKTTTINTRIVKNPMM